LAVGNADGPEGNAPIGTGHSFLYNIASGTLSDIVYPGAATTTAYGIWYNGGTSYTIVGGYSNPGEAGNGLSHGYMVDYDRATGQYSHWTSFDDPNGALGQSLITHFEGISSDQKGVYTLAATSVSTTTGGTAEASLVSVRRNTDGTFGTPHWVQLNVPTGGAKAIFTSNDSVAGGAAVGIVITDTGQEFSYQALVNTGFQLSNVISGNWGNGVGIYGGSANQIAMNNIGTDVTGTVRLGNASNGVLVTGSAVGNLIGGQATGGNDPTGNVFVRPPQGNLISANGGDGVLITDGPTLTLLSGNFVGTSASGNSALGNRLDGVGIVNASGNSLIGCTFPQDPFVFYNVISGNGGNGVRVTNSNLTTIQANFMGVGANNATVVGNGGDGLLVSGTSAYTQAGGVIPLGNVTSGNNLNGIEIRDQASNFTSFNNFAGLYAFGGAAPNRRDGILITSSGGNNLIRTCLVAGNFGNGIELAGNATGVQVTETGVGTEANLTTPVPNLGDGILITGNAHNNAIGGFQPSIDPQVTVSSNFGYGIDITGSAHNNLVFHTYIGTNYNATVALGNFRGGINLGPGTSSNMIGGTSAAMANKIVYNGGSGLTIQSSNANVILGNEIKFNGGAGITMVNGLNNLIGSAGAGNAIGGNAQDGLAITGLVDGTRVQANAISGNGGSGVILIKARNLVIGGSTPESGNGIVSNRGFGLYATGLSTGTRVQGNLIAANGLANVDVTNAPGIVYIP
ncbi:MAG TPA: right-handed parallel beta-helix repeat-containing protein, partial [Isosphaeraceae bacterium]